jgi:hypothetical protein
VPPPRLRAAGPRAGRRAPAGGRRASCTSWSCPAMRAQCSVATMPVISGAVDGARLRRRVDAAVGIDETHPAGREVPRTGAPRGGLPLTLEPVAVVGPAIVGDVRATASDRPAARRFRCSTSSHNARSYPDAEPRTTPWYTSDDGAAVAHHPLSRKAGASPWRCAARYRPPSGALQHGRHRRARAAAVPETAPVGWPRSDCPSTATFLEAATTWPGGQPAFCCRLPFEDDELRAGPDLRLAPSGRLPVVGDGLGVGGSRRRGLDQNSSGRTRSDPLRPVVLAGRLRLTLRMERHHEAATNAMRPPPHSDPNT